MVSITEYLNRGNPHAEARQLVTFLIDKIGSQAVAVDAAEYAVFSSEIESIANRITTEVTSDSLLVIAGSAAQALDSYNQRISRLFHKQGADMQGIIRMMAETVVQIGGQNTRSVQRLHEIGDQFESAGEIKDLAQLKGHLSECLRGFREEAQHQRELAETLIANLREQIESRPAWASPEEHERVDPITGLPGKDACMRALQEPVGIGKRRYVVTMSVNRIQSINARFGNPAGDHVLNAFGKFVGKQLPATDKLFRWTGPAVVAVIERSEMLDRVRAQIKRIMDIRLDEKLELGERSVLIPVSSAWSVFQLIAVATAERQIQAFIASQGNHEFA
jgi:GGDEF domain-containing protein